MTPEQIKIQKHECYLKYKETQQERRRMKMLDPEYKKSYTEMCRKWRHKNPDKVKATYPKRELARKAWRERLKDTEEYKLKSVTYASERRERLRNGNNKVKLKPSEVKQIYERDEYKCLACGSSDDLTLDHIVPICKGGFNTLDNLQVLCKTCNCSKFTKTIDYRKDKSCACLIN